MSRSPRAACASRSRTAVGHAAILYAIIHEACCADGCVTNWAAERLLPDDYEAQGCLRAEEVHAGCTQAAAHREGVEQVAKIREREPTPGVGRWSVVGGASMVFRTNCDRQTL